jgi:argininosuccinate lyase
MPGYTHLQLAQPITLAHYLMRHAEAFDRDLQRAEACFTRINRSPLGLAAMAGSSWPLDRHRVAELLGFDGLVGNGLDCGIFDSDYPAEFASTFAIAACNMSRLATDLYVWSSSEFGFVEIPDGLAGTSSIMPQKKNPHALERVMAIGGAAVGWPSSILGITKGASSTDLAMTFSEDYLGQYAHLSVSAARLLTATLDGIQLRRERMAKVANDGWATASSLADDLVRETGLSFREAHHVVARLVRSSIERGVEPSDISAVDVASASDGVVTGIKDEAVRDALDAGAFVRSRTTLGSPNPDLVAGHIAEVRASSTQHRGWLASRQERIQTARTALASRVSELAMLPSPASDVPARSAPESPSKEA